MSTTNSEQVKGTAEALVAVLKEVSGEVESANSQHKQHQYQLQSMNDAVTETIQKSVDTLTQTVETSNGTLGHKLEIMNHNLGVHLTAIRDHVREQMKQQRMRDLETFWDDGKLKDDQQFLYHTRDSSTQNCPSSSDLFFNEIRPRFVFCQGYTIPAEFSAEPYETVYYPNSYISEKRAPENGNALFITKLLAYVEQFIGHKPRLVKNDDGTHTMFYY